MRLSVVLFSVMMVCVSTAVHAQGPSYTYVEFGYGEVEIESVEDISGDGWFIGGSFGLKNVHFFGQYAQFEFDLDIEETTWGLGAGYHGLLGEKADLVAELSYVDGEIDSFFLDVDDTGYLASAGVRWLPIPLVELNGFVDRVEYDELGGETSYRANAILNLGPFGLGLGYETEDAGDTAVAFLRINARPE
jgi:hypothetical protein